MLGSDETPVPGDVVAQQIAFQHASGHVMIIGPDDTVIGTGEDERIEHIPEPPVLAQNLREHGIKFGPKVYRRWGN